MPREAGSDIREEVSRSNNKRNSLVKHTKKAKQSLPMTFYLGCQHLRLVSLYQRNSQDYLLDMPTSQSDTDSTSLGLLPCASALCHIAS